MTIASQFNRNNRPIPTMESRHFFFVADIIARQLEESEHINDEPARKMARLTLRNTAAAFALGFQQSNNKFNRDRFMDACGF